VLSLDVVIESAHIHLYAARFRLDLKRSHNKQ